MKPVISHISAVEYWRSVRYNDISLYRVSSSRSVLQVRPEAKVLDDAWLLSEPFHILVGDSSLRRPSGNLVCHVLSGTLPKGSILDSGHGYYVCSPDLTFILMATEMELVELVEFGYELCGTYDMRDGSLGSCAPLTTVKKLRSFAERAKGIPGRAKAIKALGYIADNSASPRETKLTMLLCLPYRLGGYGMSLPDLNHRVDLNDAAKYVAGKNYCICDLYWRGFRVAVEYDSDKYHAGSNRLTLDSARRAALALMGIQVITVTNDHLAHIGKFKEVARLIAKGVGKRLKYKDPQFTRACLELRKTLLR